MIVTIKLGFEAAHRLHNPRQDQSWNQRVYGKCNNPYGHGHNYVLEVAVAGEVDPETGYVIDMKVLKDIVREVVIVDCDHRHLNHEVSWLDGVNPTSENLAKIFFERIASRLPQGPTLESLTVHETPRNAATYRPG